ncbi:glycosyltransferase family 25 protein [Francisella sp. LA112445]|uniref:glycosyltransferase family 25 protein n=1 Tax=Francisella sp. LA112445 TaxID=1395624 RepID=UPI001788B6D3|nr:glycosyltransferase family 25 protein [Francisella sp. LA112445]QIW09858.1 glycosyltransferase family 25 protein [Francisella sp. LA112445]
MKIFKIFVINLAKDTVRRKYIEDHLKEKKLSYEIIEGVYGKDFYKDEINQIADLKLSYKKMGKMISVNEIGCSLSHQKIYKRIVSENLQGAFIIEDDAMFCSDIKMILDSIYNNINKLKSNCWVGLFKSHIDIKNKSFTINNNFSIYKSPRVRCAIAYYIDNTAAQNLLEYNKKITYVSDWFFGGYLNKLNLYAIDKVCVMPNPNFESTIGETRKKERNILKAIHIYFRKTYKRMYYYKYNFGVLAGRYKKTKLCDELEKIRGCPR